MNLLKEEFSYIENILLVVGLNLIEVLSHNSRDIVNGPIHYQEMGLKILFFRKFVKFLIPLWITSIGKI